MAAHRAGQAFIAVGPEFKGWHKKQKAFVESELQGIKVPAELDFGKRPLVAPPIKDPVVKPEVDQSRFRRGIAMIENRLDRLSRGRFLINVGIASSPLAAPIAGVAGGAALAGGGIAAGALGGAGAFAAVGSRSLKNIETAQKDGTGLSAGQKAVADAKASAGGALDGLAADPKLLAALAAGFTALGAAVKPLGTFLRPVSDALKSVFAQFGNAAGSAGVSNFAKTFGEFSGGVLKDAGAGLMNLAAAFGNLLVAFMPLSTEMSTGLVGLTESFATWTAGLSESAGFQAFIDYVRTNGPLLLSVLGDLGSLLVAVGTATAPLGALFLRVLSAVIPLITNFVQANPLLVQMAVGVLAASSALAAFAGPAAKIIGLIRLVTTVLRALWLVMVANPVGAVIAIIALLVIGFITAYKKSETFRAVVDKALRVVGSTFTWLWTKVIKPIFGWIEAGWKALQDLFSNPLTPKVKADKNVQKLTGVGSKNYSVGFQASGTDSWRGGLTWVGEKGPELLALPRGSAITPNHRLGSVTDTAGRFQIPIGRTKSMRFGDKMSEMSGAGVNVTQHITAAPGMSPKQVGDYAGDRALFALQSAGG